jgi:tetratricopeptide (TPR) repeat protein
MRKYILLLGIFIIGSACTNKALRTRDRAEAISDRDSRYDYILTEALRQKYEGNIDNAVKLFEKCIQEDRSRSVPYYELAQIYSAMGLEEKCLEYASRAAHLEPGNYWYQLACGSLFTQYQQKDSALVYFQRALKADKNAVEVNSILAGLYAEKGEAQKADSLFRLLDREGAMTDDMFLMMISGLINKGDLQEAAKRTEKLIGEQPSEVKYKALLADIYYEEGRKEKSDSIYRKIIEKDPENIENQLMYLLNLVYKKEYDGITGFLDNVFKSDLIERGKKIAIAERLLSDTAYVKENPESLAGSLKILEDVYPGDEEVLALRPGLYETAGRTDDAIKRYEELLKIVKPGYYITERLILLYAEKKEYDKLFSLAAGYSSANNMSILGKVYYAIAATELKKYEIAGTELKKAMILAGNNEQIKVQVLSMMGDLKYRMNEADSAYYYYEEALKIAPGEVLVLNNYAYFLAEQGKDLKKALRMIEEVMRLEGDNDTYIDTYAWVLYKMGRNREAFKEMQKIFGKEGERDPEILEHMGYIVKAAGRCGEAISYWKMALEKDSTKTYLEDEIRKCTGK